MPPVNETPISKLQQPVIQPPSRKQQSWGTILALVVIVLMIVVGALYAWGKRIAEQNTVIQETQQVQY